MAFPAAIQAFPATVFGSMVVSSRMRSWSVVPSRQWRTNPRREPQGPSGVGIANRSLAYQKVWPSVQVFAWSGSMLLDCGQEYGCGNRSAWP